MKIKLLLPSLLMCILVNIPFSLKSQDCYPPQNAVISSITQTSATISWEAWMGDAWYAIVSNTVLATPDTTQAERLSVSTYNATGLTAQTTYYYYVATICDDTISEWTTGSFMTTCLAAATPYSEPFEAYGTGANAFPPCWTKVLSSYNNYPYITAATNSLGCLVFKNSTCLVAMQEMAEAVNTLRISFNGRAESTDAGLEIGVMTDVADESNFVPIDTVYTSDVNVIENFEVHLNSYVGTGKYIAFRYMQSGRFYIDNVLISPIPNCLNPVSLSVSNITTQSAILHWTEVGTPTACQALISTTPITNFAGHTPFAVYNQQYSATGLAAHTTYYFYVQSVCGGDLSDWISTTFTTQCNATLLPVSEEFATLTIPSCWTIQYVEGHNDLIFSDFGYNPSTAPANGYAMVAWNSENYSSGAQSRLVSLPISTMGENGVEVSFVWRHSNLAPEALNEGVQLQYSFNGVTWTNSAEGLLPRYSAIYNDWANYSVTLPEVANHSTVYIGFLFTSGRGANCYLDEVELNHVSSCFKPVVNAASQITGNTAELSWTEIGNATSWNLIISDTLVTDFDATPYITVNSNTYTATNLNFTTTYYFYVQSRCSANDLSEWSNVQNFTTICGNIINLPYNENFDTYGTCSDAFPPCWSRPLTYNYYDFNNYVSCTTPSATATNYVSGSASLLFCSPSGNFTYAVSPAITADIHDIMISFYLLKENATYSGSMEIGVMSDPSDMATFEVVETLNPTEAATWSYHQILLDQTTLSGGNRYIAFRHMANSDYNYYLIDNVVIDLIPSCWHAINTEVSDITGDQALISWLDNNSSSHGWHLKVSDHPLSNMNEVGNVFDVTGLSANSSLIDNIVGDMDYYYYLQADCGNNDFSRWTSGTFRTAPCNCLVKIRMNDWGNNGWNNAYLKVYQGGELLDSVTLISGSADSAIVYTCGTGELDFRWQSGNFDNEITFAIENIAGDTIYVSAGTPIAGSLFTHQNECGVTCEDIPSSLVASNLNNWVQLSWTPTVTNLYKVYRNDTLLNGWVRNNSFIDSTVTAGYYCYTVTSACIIGESSHSNTSCATVIGIEEYNNQNITIFPNPATHYFEINSELPLNEVTVFNTLGQTVEHFKTKEAHLSVATNHWNNGLYFIQINDGRRSNTYKVMIVK